MNFIQSVKTCFKKFAVFKGRATRSEFWWFQLFGLGCSFIALTLDSALLGYDWSDTFTPLASGFEIVMVIPLMSVTARRLHDVGMSGWFQLPVLGTYLLYLEFFVPDFTRSTAGTTILMLSGLYSLFMLVKWVKDSQPFTNQYGPSPKSDGVAEVFN
jgi:uncharacterized membrane protein YhaH (DUF805 family)